MRYLTKICLLGILWIGLAGCSKGIQGNGQITTENRTLANFQQVVVNGAVNVLITTGVPQKVKVTTDSNLLADIQTSVNQGVLTINELGNLNTTATPVVTIHLKQLSAISTDGAVKLTAAKLKNNNLLVTAKGASQISLAGVVKNLQIDSSGAAKIQAVPLIAKMATVSMTGASNVRLTALRKLQVNIKDAGNLEYYGKPVIQQTISGAGSVKQITN